ncbi:MAG TPA: hypothetical protein VMR52_03805 [Dehalococcoidia bacterium]|nr:hypothetical protein [Dehalococcoidia bacterium]
MARLGGKGAAEDGGVGGEGATLAGRQPQLMQATSSPKRMSWPFTHLWHEERLLFMRILPGNREGRRFMHRPSTD